MTHLTCKFKIGDIVTFKTAAFKKYPSSSMLGLKIGERLNDRELRLGDFLSYTDNLTFTIVSISESFGTTYDIEIKHEDKISTLWCKDIDLKLLKKGKK